MYLLAELLAETARKNAARGRPQKKHFFDMAPVNQLCQKKNFPAGWQFLTALCNQQRRAFIIIIIIIIIKKIKTLSHRTIDSQTAVRLGNQSWLTRCATSNNERRTSNSENPAIPRAQVMICTPPLCNWNRRCARNSQQVAWVGLKIDFIGFFNGFFLNRAM